jgi:DNA mismatch endonuclease (patch repair protein)
MNNDAIFRAYLGGEGGTSIARRLNVPEYVVYNLLEQNGVWRPSISSQRMKQLWRDPHSAFHTEEFRKKQVLAGKAAAKSPNHYSAGLTHRIPKGVRISPRTELKPGDARTRAMAILARSRVKPRFRDTSIERVIQKALSELGMTFETHLWVERSNPDIVFPNFRLAVFCDGDYWHNLSYRRRDDEVNKILLAAGWTVLRFWEHEIMSDVGKCVACIQEVLNTTNLGSTVVQP